MRPVLCDGPQQLRELSQRRAIGRRRRGEALEARLGTRPDVRGRAQFSRLLRSAPRRLRQSRTALPSRSGAQSGVAVGASELRPLAPRRAAGRRRRCLPLRKSPEERQRADRVQQPWLSAPERKERPRRRRTALPAGPRSRSEPRRHERVHRGIAPLRASRLRQCGKALPSCSRGQPGPRHVPRAPRRAPRRRPRRQRRGHLPLRRGAPPVPRKARRPLTLTRPPPRQGRRGHRPQVPRRLQRPRWARLLKKGRFT
mmetsp:Transcript_28843/g.88239  ORF Transcript_28843/g.88239 Transcript_28843/m.88239 type:complete len:256 (+) Transcript_28843:492-1259(+)